MKKNKIVLSLLAVAIVGTTLSADWIIGGKRIMAEHPMGQSASKSVENGGDLDAIDAYQDGVGVQVSEAKYSAGAYAVDNSAFNELVFKVGERAKANDTTINDQLLNGIDNSFTPSARDRFNANKINSDEISSYCCLNGLILNEAKTKCEDTPTCEDSEKTFNGVTCSKGSTSLIPAQKNVYKHTRTSSASFSVPKNSSAVICISGAGGGGNGGLTNADKRGGFGGSIAKTNIAFSSSARSYSFTIGTGGRGGTWSSERTVAGSPGQQTTLTGSGVSLTAAGGRGGYNLNPPSSSLGCTATRYYARTSSIGYGGAGPFNAGPSGGGNTGHMSAGGGGRYGGSRGGEGGNGAVYFEYTTYGCANGTLDGTNCLVGTVETDTPICEFGTFSDVYKKCIKPVDRFCN